MQPTVRSSISLIAFFCLLLLIQPALASDYDHKERSNCDDFHHVLCIHIIRFRLCQWWNVLAPWRSLASIPFGTMVIVFVIWAFILFPLALFGTIVGRNWRGAPNNPCHVKTILRPIPDKKWYLTPSVVSLMGGLLPFGGIFIEMYFGFTSFWNYKASLLGSVSMVSKSKKNWVPVTFYKAVYSWLMVVPPESP